MSHRMEIRSNWVQTNGKWEMKAPQNELWRPSSEVYRESQNRTYPQSRDLQSSFKGAERIWID